jgi:ATP-dependent phosphofructokinase / diphosphate-dependent phosphofructokinase
MSSMENIESKGNFGIIVSGGPAPGINGVISSAVIEASNQGFKVIGFKNGFKTITVNPNEAGSELTLQMVVDIYSTGGSILGTSRFNPFRTPECKEKFLGGLRHYDVDKLIVIGGEGSAFLSCELCKVAPEIQVVHIPKTIDNDLILPNKYPSFGFETARSVGTRVMETLMVDARTCNRWYLVTSMGRKAGFLALGLGIAGGAHITLIPEEFEDTKLTARDLAAIIFGAVKRRYQLGKPNGVALLAEGILDHIDPDSSTLLKECPRDELGRIKYSQIELGDVLTPHLREMCQAENIEVSFYSKNIGYELRCYPPVSFDIEYTRFLGYGAVKFLLQGKTGIMITRDFDHLGFEALTDLVQPDGTIRARKVDLTADLYKVARRFMMR